MSDNEKPDVKPKAEGKGAPAITLVVKGQDGSDLQFKVKTTTKFEKIFSAYCQRKSIQSSGYKFIFDGDRLQDNQTPADKDMSDNDVIDAVLEQVGGCFAMQ